MPEWPAARWHAPTCKPRGACDHRRRRSPPTSTRRRTGLGLRASRITAPAWLCATAKRHRDQVTARHRTHQPLRRPDHPLCFALPTTTAQKAASRSPRPPRKSARHGDSDRMANGRGDCSRAMLLLCRVMEDQGNGIAREPAPGCGCTVPRGRHIVSRGARSKLARWPQTMRCHPTSPSPP